MIQEAPRPSAISQSHVPQPGLMPHDPGRTTPELITSWSLTADWLRGSFVLFDLFSILINVIHFLETVNLACCHTF